MLLLYCAKRYEIINGSVYSKDYTDYFEFPRYKYGGFRNYGYLCRNETAL